MGIYRGPGGVGDAVNDAASEAAITVIARDEAVAARNAALAAETAAELAETNAETAEAGANTSKIAAQTAATSAATSSSAASTYAANAATSANNASTSETNAAAYELSANNWATKTSGPVAGGEYSSKYNAQLAATSASTATTQASAASTSATAASAAKVAAESARDATLAAYDNFDDRYLGVKSVDPTLDNDGNALVAGALYFSSTDGSMKVYTGTAWTAAYVSGAGVLLIANNLSDVSSASASRTNLGLGTAATTNSTAYATAAQGTSADTAFGWGNHASVGYATYPSQTGNSGKYLKTNGTTAAWDALDISTADISGILPIANGGTNGTATPTAGGVIVGTGTAYASTAAGTAGQLLTSNGTSAPTWQAAPVSLPSQTGNTGKYLTTDGTTASWGTVSAGATLANDTSTASNLYPIFAAATSGVPTTVYTSNAKYLYKPSTGELQASVFNASNGIYINNMTVSTSVSIPSGSSAMSVGPITVAAGQTVTVPSGSRWVIL